MPTTYARTTTPATVTDAGTLEGLLVPWNTPATVRDAAGAPSYVESFAPGSLRPGSVVPVYAGHVHDETGNLVRGPLIGRAVDLESTDAGLRGRVILAATTDAQAVRELARTVGAAFSIEFVSADPEPRPGSTVIRTDALLSGLSVILPPYAPAYPSAQVTNVRGTAMPPLSTDPYGPANPDPDPAAPDPTPGDPPAPPDPDPSGPPTEPVEPVELGRVAEVVRREMARYATPAAAAPTHPLARFDSFASFAAFMWTANEADHQAYGREFGRALADQTTAESPGLMPPGWVRDVKGIVNLGRPFITHIGTTPDAGTGMDVNWPYTDTPIGTLVGQQTAEKAGIVSVDVPIKKGTTPLLTYAGGSDISYQLLRRSAPPYVDAYLRIMAAAMAYVTDQAAATAAYAAATGKVTYDMATADPNGQIFKAAVFTASTNVQDATGMPADVVLAATDVFIHVGSILTPRPIMNAAGAAEASTLLVDVSGLEVIRVPSMASGTALVTNKMAAGWLEDGPFVVQMDDVEKLGRNVAVWSMGALTPFTPAGLVQLAP